MRLLAYLILLSFNNSAYSETLNLNHTSCDIIKLEVNENAIPPNSLALSNEYLKVSVHDFLVSTGYAKLLSDRNHNLYIEPSENKNTFFRALALLPSYLNFYCIKRPRQFGKGGPSPSPGMHGTGGNERIQIFMKDFKWRTRLQSQ